MSANHKATPFSVPAEESVRRTGNGKERGWLARRFAGLLRSGLDFEIESQYQRNGFLGQSPTVSREKMTISTEFSKLDHFGARSS
jgi:hypothetical protein